MPFADRPLVLGHRGAPRRAPENTMRAFELALQQGADGVELDIQPAGDGAPVVIHDDTLDRTTDARGALAQRSWEGLAEVRAGGEPVPHLTQVVEWAAERGAWLNVEVKSSGPERACVQAVADGGLLDRTFFSSFRPEVVRTLREAAPEGRVLLLTERWDEQVRSAVRELRVDGVCLHDPIADEAALRWLAAEGLEAVVWTVDAPERLRALLHAGVAAVITNLPELSAQRPRTG